MRINRLNTEGNSASGKIKELTIYHVLNNSKSHDINISKNINTSNISIQKDKDIHLNKSHLNDLKTEYNSLMPETNTYKNNKNYQQELFDDEYILSLHQKLEEKKELRKISEQNVKILNGRVRCLKDENKKTLAKIDLTKKKTKEKERAISYHRSRSKEKKEYLEKKENELKLLKEKNRYQKLVTQSNLINTRENLYLKNQLKGQISKAQKVNNENIKKENELINKIAKQNKIEVIRNNAVNYTKKKKLNEIKKKEEMIKNLNEKINLENKKKKELDDELSKLMSIENEILQRIFENNEMQKKLIESFEMNYGGGYGMNDTLISVKNNISCINDVNTGLEQLVDEYDYDEIKEDF